MSMNAGPSHERTEMTVLPPTQGPGLEPTMGSTVAATSAARFEPDAYVAGAVGLLFLLVGLIAAIRGGFKGPMSLPVVKVLGFTHTTTLGLVDCGIGAFLMVAAGMRSRSAEVFGGVVLGIAGFVGVVQHKSFVRTLALAPGWAWLAMITGIAVALAALVLPRYVRNTTLVQQR
jgi:hypothetical protein